MSRSISKIASAAEELDLKALRLLGCYDGAILQSTTDQSFYKVFMLRDDYLDTLKVFLLPCTIEGENIGDRTPKGGEGFDLQNFHRMLIERNHTGPLYRPT